MVGLSHCELLPFAADSHSTTEAHEHQQENILNVARTMLRAAAGKQGRTNHVDRLQQLFILYDKKCAGTLDFDTVQRLIRKDLKLGQRKLPEKDLHLVLESISSETGALDCAALLNFLDMRRVDRRPNEVILKQMGKCLQRAIKRGCFKLEGLDLAIAIFQERGSSKSADPSPQEVVRFFRQQLQLTKTDCSDYSIHSFFRVLSQDGELNVSWERIVDFIRSYDPSLKSSTANAVTSMRGKLISGSGGSFALGRMHWRASSCPSKLRGGTVSFEESGRERPSHGRLAATSPEFVQMTLPLQLASSATPSGGPQPCKGSGRPASCGTSQRPATAGMNQKVQQACSSQKRETARAEERLQGPLSGNSQRLATADIDKKAPQTSLSQRRETARDDARLQGSEASQKPNPHIEGKVVWPTTSVSQRRDTAQADDRTQGSTVLQNLSPNIEVQVVGRRTSKAPAALQRPRSASRQPLAASVVAVSGSSTANTAAADLNLGRGVGFATEVAVSMSNNSRPATAPAKEQPQQAARPTVLPEPWKPIKERTDRNSYHALKGAKRLNRIESRFLEVGIDVRGEMFRKSEGRSRPSTAPDICKSPKTASVAKRRDEPWMIELQELLETE